MQHEVIQRNEAYNVSISGEYFDSSDNKKSASHSQLRLPFRSFTCGTMVVAVLALAAAVVAVILSVTVVIDNRWQTHSLIDRLDSIQNGETYSAVITILTNNRILTSHHSQYLPEIYGYNQITSLQTNNFIVHCCSHSICSYV